MDISNVHRRKYREIDESSTRQYTATTKWRIKKKCKGSVTHQQVAAEEPECSEMQNESHSLPYNDESIHAEMYDGMNDPKETADVSLSHEPFDQQFNCKSSVMADLCEKISHESTATEDCKPQDNELIYKEGKITFKQSFLLVLAFCLRYSLSKAAVENLLDLINVHLPKNISLPNTYYMFKKLSQCFAQCYAYTYHYYCPTCINFVKESDTQCGRCTKHICKEQLKKDGCFYLAFNLKSQLIALLSNEQLKACIFENIESSKNRNGFENKANIMQGKQYQKVVTGKYDLSCTLNTDGVPLFKSSSVGMWPILFTLNELSYSQRRPNTLMAGVWCGKGKPKFDKFFMPFIDNMQELHDVGISWTFGEKTIHSKVHFLPFVADSVARCSVQGLQQHNGSYGCNYCLIKTVSVENVPTKRAYMPERKMPAERTHQNYISCLKQKLIDPADRDSTFGVLRKSPLLHIKCFDIIKNCPIDYMHNVCLGVVRYFTLNWLDSKNHKEIFYLGLKIKIIDRFLSKVHVPDELPRTVRSLAQVSHWKANEWKTWLFVAPIALQNVLSKTYLNHFTLLSSSIQIMISDHITKADIGLAKKMLNDFVTGVASLYGPKFCTYNVHLLSHLSTTVDNFGGLYNSSCFVFESFNGCLLKMFSETQCVAEQICKKYADRRLILDAAGTHFSHSPFQNVLENILFSKRESLNCVKFGEVSLIGRAKINFFNDKLICQLVEDYFHETAIEMIGYRHFMKERIKFSVRPACFQQRQNFFMQLSQNKFLILQAVIHVKTLSKNSCIGIGNECHVQQKPNLGLNVLKAVENETRLTIFNLNDVLPMKFIVVKMEGCHSAIKLSNTFELD